MRWNRIPPGKWFNSHFAIHFEQELVRTAVRRVSHLRRSAVVDWCTQCLRTGLTYAAPPALSEAQRQGLESGLSLVVVCAVEDGDGVREDRGDGIERFHGAFGTAGKIDD